MPDLLLKIVDLCKSFLKLKIVSCHQGGHFDIMALSFHLTPVLVLRFLGCGTLLVNLTCLLVSSFLSVNLSQQPVKFAFVILFKFIELVGVSTNTRFKVSSVTFVPLTEIRRLLFI